MSLKIYRTNGQSGVYFGEWIAECINDYFGATKATYSSSSFSINGCLGITSATSLTFQYMDYDLSSIGLSVLAIDSTKNFLMVLIPAQTNVTNLTNRIILCIYKDYSNNVVIWDYSRYTQAPFNISSDSMYYSNIIYSESTWTAPDKVYLYKLIIGQAVIPDYMYVSNFKGISGQEINSSDGVNTYICLSDNFFIKKEE